MSDIDPRTKQNIDEGLEIILALDSDEVTTSAKRIAFYSALIATGMDYESEEKKIFEYLRETLTQELEFYIKITDALL